MRETVEAVVLLCKCAEGRKTYGMRAEKTGRGRWLITWAFPIKEAAAKREEYDKAQIKGDILFSEEYPGCPYCGGRGVTVCSCGHLNCTILTDGVFICQWCGQRGVLGDYAGEAITAGTDY